MDSNLRTVGFIIGFLLLGIGLYFYVNSKVNWDIDYDETSEGPYGTYYFLKWLEENIDDDGQVSLWEQSVDSFAQTQEIDEVYIALNRYWNTPNFSSQDLYEHIEKGHTMVLGFENISDGQFDYIYTQDSSVYIEEDEMPMEEVRYSYTFNDTLLFDNLKGDTVLFQSFGRDGPFSDYYLLLQPTSIPNSKVLLETSMADAKYAIMVEISIGEGKLYLLSAPRIAANISLTDRQNFDVVTELFSTFKSKKIVWDTQKEIQLSPQSQQSFDTASPLALLFSSRSMKAAWFTMLFMVVSYLLLNLKRRQRIIPVVVEKPNTELSFAQSIGKLNFSYSNDRKLCIERMQHFLILLREKYNFNIKPNESEFSSQLATLLELDLHKVEAVVKEYLLIHKTVSINPKRALLFCKKLQQLRKVPKL